MKAFLKIMLGILTVLPLLGFCAFFPLMTSRQLAVPLQLLYMSSMVFLPYLVAVIYIVTVLQNKRFDGEKKALWAVVLVIGWSIAQIIYWYLYIWRKPLSQPVGVQNS